MDALSFFIRSGLGDEQYDLNGDGSVDGEDHAAWFTLTGTIPGDIDFDGAVAFADFLRLSDNFGQPGNYCQGDLTGDRLVSFADFLLLSANFGASADVEHVPEPSSHLTLAVFAFLVTRTRKRCV